jgi:hypothetical protein
MSSHFGFVANATESDANEFPAEGPGYRLAE